MWAVLSFPLPAQSKQDLLTKAFMQNAEFTEDFTRFAVICSKTPQQTLSSWTWSCWVSLFPLQAHNLHAITKLYCRYYEDNENKKTQTITGIINNVEKLKLPFIVDENIK